MTLIVTLIMTLIVKLIMTLIMTLFMTLGLHVLFAGDGHVVHVLHMISVQKRTTKARLACTPAFMSLYVHAMHRMYSSPYIYAQILFCL